LQIGLMRSVEKMRQIARLNFPMVGQFVKIQILKRAGCPTCPRNEF
jgi:hypothetical protein